MTKTRWAVEEHDAGLRLDKFLAAPDRVGSRGRAITALERGKVFLNDVEVGVAEAGRRLETGDTIRVWADRPGSAKPKSRAFTAGDLRILFEDSSLIVVNKPPGVLAVPLERRGDAVSVYDQVEDHFRSRGKKRPFVVHRIDRDTSGIVLFAKDARTQAHLKGQFRRREPERVYRAVVYGCPDPPSGVWRDHLVWDQKALIQKATHPRDPHGDEAISEYSVIEKLRDASLIEVRLRTGKRNQIRLQSRLRGHTLVGEQRYVYGPDVLRPIKFPRQALHAYRLSFRHPVTDALMEFEAPLPADLVALLERLRPTRRS